MNNTDFQMTVDKVTKYVEDITLTRNGMYELNGKKFTKADIITKILEKFDVLIDISSPFFQDFQNAVIGTIESIEAPEAVSTIRNPTKIDFEFFKQYKVCYERHVGASYYALKEEKTQTFEYMLKFDEMDVCLLPDEVHEYFKWIVENPGEFERDPKLTPPLGFVLSNDRANGNPIWDNRPRNLAAYYKNNLMQMVEDKHIVITERPKQFSNNPNEPNLSYFDLNFPEEYGETPTWDSFLSRFTPDQKDTFLAYVYSIFDAKNRGRQAMYIQGNGYDGKSTMINVITKYLGNDNATTITPQQARKEFAFSNVYGKRLVNISDLKDHNFLRGGFVHNITGNDICSIESKGMQPFSVRLHCKLMIASNISPEIDVSADHERSRLIYLKMKPTTDETLKNYCKVDENGNVVKDKFGNPIFMSDPVKTEAKLLEEMPKLLTKARAIYKELCPTNNDIIIPESVTEDIMNSCEDPMIQLYDEFMDTMIEFNHENRISSLTLMQEVSKYCNMNHIPFDTNMKGMDWKNFLKHLRVKYELNATKVRVNGQNPKMGFHGIGLKKDAVGINKIAADILKEV